MIKLSADGRSAMSACKPNFSMIPVESQIHVERDRSRYGQSVKGGNESLRRLVIRLNLKVSTVK